jgi:protein phosphatase
MLVNSFGAQQGEVKIDVQHVSLKNRDRLLVCTDGLTDMVTNDEIAAVLTIGNAAEGACDALIERALRNGGKHNVSVVVADLHFSAA